MTYIRCERAGQNWQTYCEFCSTPLDIVTSEEIVGMLREHQQVICFDCDGGADVVPEILLSDIVPYHLVLDGKVCKVDPFEEMQSLRWQIRMWRTKFKQMVRFSVKEIIRICQA